jgi:hypothetical protein
MEHSHADNAQTMNNVSSLNNEQKNKNKSKAKLKF